MAITDTSDTRGEVALSLLNITNRDALQGFLGGDGVSTGSNQIGSPISGTGPTVRRGRNRQAAR